MTPEAPDAACTASFTATTTTQRAGAQNLAPKIHHATLKLAETNYLSDLCYGKTHLCASC
nr:MAG TPA: hypothetical protein [Caudoviricetes sp.]